MPAFFIVLAILEGFFCGLKTRWLTLLAGVSGFLLTLFLKKLEKSREMREELLWCSFLLMPLLAAIIHGSHARMSFTLGGIPLVHLSLLLIVVLGVFAILVISKYFSFSGMNWLLLFGILFYILSEAVPAFIRGVSVEALLAGVSVTELFAEFPVVLRPVYLCVRFLLPSLLLLAETVLVLKLEEEKDRTRSYIFMVFFMFALVWCFAFAPLPDLSRYSGKEEIAVSRLIEREVSGENETLEVKFSLKNISSRSISEVELVIPLAVRPLAVRGGEVTGWGLRIASSSLEPSSCVCASVIFGGLPGVSDPVVLMEEARYRFTVEGLERSGYLSPLVYYPSSFEGTEISRSGKESETAIACLLQEKGSEIYTLFDFFRKNIFFEPYEGRLKSPEAVFMTLKASSLDAAVALVECLKRAGFPAKTVKGMLKKPAGKKILAGFFSHSQRELLCPEEIEKLVLDVSKEHFSVETFFNGKWISLDPLFPGASMGESYSTLSYADRSCGEEGYTLLFSLRRLSIDTLLEAKLDSVTASTAPFFLVFLPAEELSGATFQEVEESGIYPLLLAGRNVFLGKKVPGGPAGIEDLRIHVEEKRPGGSEKCQVSGVSFFVNTRGSLSGSFNNRQKEEIKDVLPVVAILPVAGRMREKPAGDWKFELSSLDFLRVELREELSRRINRVRNSVLDLRFTLDMIAGKIERMLELPFVSAPAADIFSMTEGAEPYAIVKFGSARAFPGTGSSRGRARVLLFNFLEKIIAESMFELSNSCEVSVTPVDSPDEKTLAKLIPEVNLREIAQRELAESRLLFVVDKQDSTMRSPLEVLCRNRWWSLEPLTGNVSFRSGPGEDTVLIPPRSAGSIVGGSFFLSRPDVKVLIEKCGVRLKSILKYFPENFHGFSRELILEELNMMLNSICR